MATVSQELEIKISASTSRLKNALNKAKTSVRNFANKAKMALKAVGMAFLALGAGAFMLGKKLVSMAMTFQTEMAQVSTLIDGITDNQLQKMSTEVLQLSSKFGMATSAMSKGLYDLVSAGVDAKDSINALEIATKSAIAGATNTATSVDALTSIVNAYGKVLGENLSYTQKMEKASDYLFTIIKYGKTTYAELSQSIGEVTSVAATAEVGLRELGAMIAVLTKVGVKTPAAITSIRAVLTTLMKPQETAIHAAKQMGIEFSLQALKAKGLYGFLTNLKQKMDEHNEAVRKGIKVGEEYNTATLFGNVRALKGVIVAIGKARSEYDSLFSKMENTTGETEKAFAKMEATSAHKINKMIQTISNLGLTMGLQILEPLAKWIEMETQASDGWLKTAQDLQLGTKLIEGMASAFYGVQFALLSVVQYFDDYYFKAKTVCSMVTFAFQSGIDVIKIKFYELALTASESMARMFEPLKGKVPWVKGILEKWESANLKLKNTIRQSNYDLTKDQIKYQSELKKTIALQKTYKDAYKEKLETLGRNMVTPLMQKKEAEPVKKQEMKTLQKEIKPISKKIEEKQVSYKTKTFAEQLEDYKNAPSGVKIEKPTPDLSSWKKEVGWQEQKKQNIPLKNWKKEVGWQEQKKEKQSNINITINANDAKDVARKVSEILEKEEKRKIKSIQGAR